MYKIIGADGKEYGPVTAEQLRQWITEGRANAQTRVQADGETEWKTMGELPEFASSLSAAAGSHPSINPPKAIEVWAAEIVQRDYTVEASGWIKLGWELVKRDFWLLVGASFIAGIIASGCGIPYLGILIALILGGPMIGGLYLLYLKKIRGQPVTLGDAFAGFGAMFVPLMLAKIVSGLLTGLGLLLCILPGIYLYVAWSFTLPLVIDKNMDFWPAMDLSRKMVAKHWWGIFGFGLLCFLVALLGLLACCVGIFVAAAVVQAAFMYAYEDIFGTRTAKTV